MKQPLRGSLVAAVFCLLALVVAGCTSAGPATPQAAPAAAGASPVSITHMYGTTEVPAVPARVVALSGADADAAVALGVVPVMVPQFIGVPPGALPPWLAGAVGDPPPQVMQAVSNNDGRRALPFEQIAGARPDVILAMNYAIEQAEYDRLSQIAPTVAPVVGNNLDRWQDITTTVGDVLGKRAEAEALVTEVESGVDEVAAAHPQFRGHSIVLSLLLSHEQFGLIVDTDESTLALMYRLGFSLPPVVDALEPTNGFATQLARERADLLEADVALAYAPQPGVFDGYRNDPLVSRLDVVRRDALVTIEPVVWGALRNPSVLTIPYAVGTLADRLDTVNMGSA